MPTFERRQNGQWRVRVMREGKRESATFRTKQEAAAWAVERAAELTGAKRPDKSLGDALARYRETVTPTHRGHRWEAMRLKALEADEVARRPLARLCAADLSDWRDRRLAQVSPGSVAREMNILRAVLRLAWKEWGWLGGNPLEGVKPPRAPASRKRRISPDEAERVMLACGVTDLEADTAMNRVGLAFAFALETAMRAGEITGMRWEDVGEKSVSLPRTKNGDQRRVPLSPRAREILAALPRIGPHVFGLESATRDVLFRRARQASQVDNLRFHDARAEAIWRLSKKLDVLDLARIIGHRDPRSLMIYYNADADELADRL